MSSSLACSSRAAMTASTHRGAVALPFRTLSSLPNRPSPAQFACQLAHARSGGRLGSCSLAASLGCRSVSDQSVLPSVGARSGPASSFVRPSSSSLVRLYATSPSSYPTGESPPPQLETPSAPPPRPTSFKSYFQRLADRKYNRRPDQAASPYRRVPLPPLPAILRRRFVIPLLILSIFILSSTASYNLIPATRHFSQAVLRCGRLMYAVLLDAVDYKRTFNKTFADDAERIKEYKACHLRSAKRMLSALEDLGGIYIKLGQHLSSVAVIPIEWSSTMSVLQDRCPASSPREIAAMIEQDTGKSRELFFSDWDPVPIGIASIAQVHLATDRETGQRVAVKLQHPNLEEWSGIDLMTVNFAVGLIDRWFPTFKFGWLADEINESLPLEMDFRIEAKNAARTRQDFASFPDCTLYIPDVKWCEKRILVMEYIEGARVDDIPYLDKHHIDRNLVSKELSRIFSQMVYLNGFFHADPHQGNVLIRPRPQDSRSPHNFEVVLLDHGQYFDLDDQLRVNYARFWLSLITPNSPAVQEERRKYAKLVGNVDGELYPILESALTGRIGLGRPDYEEQPYVDEKGLPKNYSQQKAQSVMEMEKATEEEEMIMRNAVIEREGLLADIFKMLRSVPRRILIVIKLNDLTRSLDNSLETTHGQARVFMIVAHYCARAIWYDDLAKIKLRYRSEGVSFSLLSDWFGAFFRFHSIADRIRLAELWADGKGKAILWWDGKRSSQARLTGGLAGM